MNIGYLYIRNCPQCNIEIKYKQKGKCLRFDKMKLVCIKCKEKNKKRKRICPNPECNKEIIYKSKRGYFEAKRKISLCRSCSLSKSKKGKPSNRKDCKLTEEQRNNISKYMKGLRSGEKHPMYGKKHTEIAIEKIRISSSGINNGMYGKKHSTESKIKISKSNKGKPGPKISDKGLLTLRQKRIKEIEIDKFNGSQIIPSFNKKSCLFFDNIEKELNWNGSYATKNGEVYIKDLGYWLDYYEPNLNIVIEWDERNHFNIDGTLKEEDIRRQEEIEKLLNCKFYRIKQDKNLDLNKIINELKIYDKKN